MPSFNDYWLAREKAFVKPEQCRAWKNLDAFHQNSLDCLNKAFETYYIARKNLELCQDSKEKGPMVSELEECAKVGGSWIIGSRSLKQAFEHFAKYGNWTDDALDVYYAKPWSLWSGIDHYTKGVTAGVNFLTAFDAKCQKSMEAILAFESQAQKLNDAGELDKLTEEGVRSRGVRIAEIIKDIHEKAEDAEKFLWWTARSTEALDSLRFAFGSDWEAFAKAAEACEKCHGYLEKFGGPLGKGVGAADNIVKGYETYQRATRAGFSEGAAAAIATLQKAMEFVPVFGELYANVLGAVPEITEPCRRNSQRRPAARSAVRTMILTFPRSGIKATCSPLRCVGIGERGQPYVILYSTFWGSV
jgi:hypothetical protein